MAPKRLHHRASKQHVEEPVAHQRPYDRSDERLAALGDFERSDYPSDFRWPESYFDLEASSDVAVVVGQTAFLVCRVAVAGNWTVRDYMFLRLDSYIKSVSQEAITVYFRLVMYLRMATGFSE